MYEGLKLVSILIAVLFTAIIAKILFFALYSIPSTLMEQTLQPGDQIFVSKFHYDPLLTQSLFKISWINVLIHLNKNTRSPIDSN